MIVRFGGDEFVCALANMDAEDVQRRFADIIETLEANGFAAPISFGVADLEDTDDLERLLERADARPDRNTPTTRTGRATGSAPLIPQGTLSQVKPRKTAPSSRSISAS